VEESDNNKQSYDIDDEIDLRELFFLFIKERLIIISFTALLSIIGIIYSLQIPNIFESNTLLAPVEESLSSNLDNYRGLAGLAGITLPSANSGNNSKKAFEMMGSLSFFEKHIMPNIFLPDLMAVDYWDHKSNTIIYDEDIYNKNSNTWVRDTDNPNKLVPSAQQSYKVFKGSHFNISEEDDSGYITLTIKHQSPFIAKEWAETIVKEINNFYREKDKAGSEKSVIYLNEQMSKTGLSEIKQVTAELLGQEIQKLTLIEANIDYVFEYIYPPSAMEQKSEPNRSFIVIFFALFGGILGVLIILFRHYFLAKK
tara:strand:+ start:178 stop:1113 length:936 start_codon:yes stop_codon:yes gene_type:complete